MSTYICTKCGCIDNTALNGNYWTASSKQNRPVFEDDFYNNNIVCSECCPPTYKDGSIKKGAGKWHNEFEKLHWHKYGTAEMLVKMCNEEKGNVVNAIEYFKDKKITQ